MGKALRCLRREKSSSLLRVAMPQFGSIRAYTPAVPPLTVEALELEVGNGEELPVPAIPT